MQVVEACPDAAAHGAAFVRQHCRSRVTEVGSNDRITGRKLPRRTVQPQAPRARLSTALSGGDDTALPIMPQAMQLVDTRATAYSTSCRSRADKMG